MDMILTVLLALLAAGVAVIGLGTAVYSVLWATAMFYGWQTTRQEDHALRRVRARKRRRAEFRRILDAVESGTPAPRLTDFG